MAKRNRSITPKVRERRRKEGRGLGTGKDYKPGLHIQDVSSIGLATRDKGWKTDRVHHFMSKLEWLFFYLLEWSLCVIDIREQFPLDFDETLAIAKSLGIKHPTDPKTKEPIVMTTDFVVVVGNTIREVMHARTVKYTGKLSSCRVMEKFEIERVYWTRRNVDWGIVTERDIAPAFAANVEWVHSHRDETNLSPVTKATIQDVEAYLAPLMLSHRYALRDLTNACDKALSLALGTSLTVVRHLIANRRLEVDMNVLIQPEQCVPLITKPVILL